LLSNVESKVVVFEQSAAVRVALARIASLKNDYTLASKYYRDAVILMPDEPTIRRSYAESLFYAGKLGDAAIVLEEIRKQPGLSDKGNVALMLGQCYMGLHRAREARNLFQEAIRENSNNNTAYMNLGKACLQTGDLQMTLSAARTILRTDPRNVQAMILTALVQQKQNNWTDAAATLEKASRIAPNDSTILCMLGINAQQQGRRDEANGFYEKAVKANPNDSWAMSLLGKTAVSQEESNKASEEGSGSTDAGAGAASDAVGAISSSEGTPVAAKSH
jgi:tetratricopeptide (TPR) repeat protein